MKENENETSNEATVATVETLQTAQATLSYGTQVTIQNLLTVKSIVTVLLTVVFSVLALKGTISGEQFLTIFSVVIAFYFGTQYQKNNNDKDKE